MQRLGDFPSILKRHCKPLSPLREKSTQSNVPLLNSCTDRQHRTSMSAYKHTNKGPPWVHQRYSRHPGNHTSSFSLCTFVCTSAKWNYFQRLQRVFKHKDRDKVRARTTKNQEHVDSIKTKNKQKNNTTDLETDLTRQDKTDNKARESAQQTGKHMGVQTGQEMGGNTERMRIAALLNLEEIFFIFFSCLSSIKWCLNKAARWYLTLEEINFESSCQKWCQSPQQKQRGKKGFSFPKTCLGYKHRPPWLTKTAEVNRNTHTHQKKKKFSREKKKTNKKYSLVNLLLANPQRAYRAQ